MGLYLLNRARTYLTRKVFDEKGDRRAKERSEVEEIAVSHHIGTQESIVNNFMCHVIVIQNSFFFNGQGHPSCMGHSMWPNMMPHPMRPNMAQGGSIFPFFPTLCPTATSLNQFMPSFPSSQSLLNGQV
ncbi:hypothetical protein RHGRI_013907 [Rhododendron griersonianum]|uniref:Uncharacterized protein n=1 Tax=Rhododendron griersonianum TaxID=479676 RepID=A0AAV6K7B0_9ERIC|nr:hypothetical protein RHGRI_013907 [Rhododendron griersonianum]